MEKVSRREAMRRLGIFAGSAAAVTAVGRSAFGNERKQAPEPSGNNFTKPLTAITLGAGSRGNVYGGYSLL